MLPAYSGLQPRPGSVLNRSATSEPSALQRTVRGTFISMTRDHSTSLLSRSSIPTRRGGGRCNLQTLGQCNFANRRGETLVWKSNAYIPGTLGLSGARADAHSIVSMRAPVAYYFTLSFNHPLSASFSKSGNNVTALKFEVPRRESCSSYRHLMYWTSSQLKPMGSKMYAELHRRLKPSVN